MILDATLAKLGRRKVALEALDQAKECCDDPSGVDFQSLSLEALSDLGEHARATDAAKSLAAMPRLAPGDRDAVYDLAAICAQKMQALPAFGACTVVGLMASPHGLGPLLAAPALIPGRGAEKGQSVPDLYENAALGLLNLGLLKRLRAEGYFRDPARRKLLTDDPKLAPLRSRPAFQRLPPEEGEKRARP
jgi:hypothetical protein